MGSVGVSKYIDMPTIMERESDNPQAEEKVWSYGGLGIESLQDMRSFLKRSPPDKISINYFQFSVFNHSGEFAVVMLEHSVHRFINSPAPCKMIY